jgi:hypothetical protein
MAQPSMPIVLTADAPFGGDPCMDSYTHDASKHDISWVVTRAAYAVSTCVMHHEHMQRALALTSAMCCCPCRLVDLEAWRLSADGASSALSMVLQSLQSQYAQVRCTGLESPERTLAAGLPAAAPAPATSAFRGRQP